MITLNTTSIRNTVSTALTLLILGASAGIAAAAPAQITSGAHGAAGFELTNNASHYPQPSQPQVQRYTEGKVLYTSPRGAAWYLSSNPQVSQYQRQSEQPRYSQVASLPNELEQLNPLDHPPAPGGLFSATSQPSMTLAGIDNWSPEQINPLDHPPAPASFLKLQPSQMMGLTTNTDNIQQLNPLDHPPAPNSLG
jgi:hypothetical protein